MVVTLTPRARPTRRLALALLVLAVLAAHGLLTSELADRMASLDPAQAMPPRIAVAYVRELQLAPPPPVAPAPAPPLAVPQPRVKAPAVPASAPEVAPPPAVPEPPVVPEPVPEPPVAVALDPVPESVEPAASPVEPVLAAASAAEPAASAPPAFDWPGSTRLSYELSGNVRGEVHGKAQVEWVRVGSRYQVHLDLTVGLPIAPLITRRMSSDGEITSAGLLPQRYDEDTKVMFRDRRRLTMQFQPDVVVLPDGQRRERWPGMQDTASQFVQLSWLFTTQPELLRTGGQVEIPLALPRSVDRWIYDIGEEEIVYTPFGHVPAFHLTPRRVSRPGAELVAEIWFAPQMRYLPARIRIQQDPQTFIDLVLARRPELAGP